MIIHHYILIIYIDKALDSIILVKIYLGLQNPTPNFCVPLCQPFNNVCVTPFSIYIYIYIKKITLFFIKFELVIVYTLENCINSTHYN